MTDMSSWKVLVIEDEGDSMDLVQEILYHYNIETYAAFSAEEALSQIAAVRPTLLIVDLALPGMDGWGLLKVVRGMPETAALPAVAVTAFHSANVAQEAISAGFNAYFPKPIDSTSFVRELVRVLDSA